MPKVAEALGVRYVLKGSVRRNGRRLRIVAALSNAAGTLQWSDCFRA